MYLHIIKYARPYPGGPIWQKKKTKKKTRRRRQRRLRRNPVRRSGMYIQLAVPKDNDPRAHHFPPGPRNKNTVICSVYRYIFFKTFFYYFIFFYLRPEKITMLSFGTGFFFHFRLYYIHSFLYILRDVLILMYIYIYIRVCICFVRHVGR